MTAALNVIAINNTITLLRRSPELFDMGSFGFAAGKDWDGSELIGGCLARFALEANGHRPVGTIEQDNGTALLRAMSVLGLKDQFQANALFTNYDGMEGEPGCPLSYDRVRPAHAIAVLEILRDTKQVQWSPAIHKVMRDTWGSQLDRACLAVVMLGYRDYRPDRRSTSPSPAYCDAADGITLRKYCNGFAAVITWVNFTQVFLWPLHYSKILFSRKSLPRRRRLL